MPSLAGPDAGLAPCWLPAAPLARAWRWRGGRGAGKPSLRLTHGVVRAGRHPTGRVGRPQRDPLEEAGIRRRHVAPVEAECLERRLIRHVPPLPQFGIVGQDAVIPAIVELVIASPRHTNATIKTTPIAVCLRGSIRATPDSESRSFSPAMRSGLVAIRRHAEMPGRAGWCVRAWSVCRPYAHLLSCLAWSRQSSPISCTMSSKACHCRAQPVRRPSCPPASACAVAEGKSGE